MANPFHCYRGVRALLPVVAVDVLAGLRSALPEHPLAPPTLPRCVITVRLGVAAVCFAGGLAFVRVFVECLLGASAVCPSVTPDVPGLVAVGIAMALLLRCVVWCLLRCEPASTRPFLSLAEAFPGDWNHLSSCRAEFNHG